jgi:hypothetical protein
MTLYVYGFLEKMFDTSRCEDLPSYILIEYTFEGRSVVLSIPTAISLLERCIK